MLLGFTAFSCGIEQFVYLEKPVKTADPSNFDDERKKYCAFITADAENTANAAEYYKGTEVYYRIYENEKDYVSDKSAINTYNERNPSSAAQYLQDTKKYHCLATSDSLGHPLIRAASANRSVRFRLQNYDAADPAMLTLDGRQLGVPCRSSRIPSDKRRFEPKNISVSDDDVQKTSSGGSDAFWWVNFYAASYGYNDAFLSLYSSLEPLGSIKLGKKP